MRIFKSAIFWLILAGLLLGLGLFFLLPVLGVKSLAARWLWSLLPPLLGGLIALILSIFRLKKALKGQESSQANPFEADIALRPWQEPLKAETKQALDILKASGKGKVRVGQNPLDIFRFYLVLGNAGTGRTTLMEQSGIHFPRRFPNAAELAKQTQHFTQWWFSNQGIFLETPARYASGEEGDDEFQYWLSQLEREGKPTALDGILLTVSLKELLAEGPAVNELASRYREKIALTMSTLRLELPVYLIFTHADMMPGFREYFENLQEPESHQVFGATFALRGNLPPARARFEREYKKLYESLLAHTPERLSQLTDTGRKKSIFVFANEFGAAQERLATFVEHLFKDSMRRERALFRGFFLTSVTAPGAARDAFAAADPFASSGPAEDQAHFLDHRARKSGPAAASPKSEAMAKPRALFANLIFGGVLKNDKSLAQIPGYRLGSLSRRALIASSIMVVVGLFMTAWSLMGFFSSRSYLGGIALTVDEAGKLRFRNPVDFREEYAVMGKLLAAARSLEEDGGPSLPPGYGHNGEALELVGKMHAAQMVRMAGADALRNLGATLELATRIYNPAEHARLRDNLRLYLLLTSEGRKHLKEIKSEEFGNLLGALWTQEVLHRFGVEYMPANMETGMEEHARWFAERYLDQDIAPLAKGDPGLVQGVRNSLMGAPSIEGLYAALVAAEDPARDLTIADMGVPSDAALKSAAKIRGFYTKAAFDDDAMDRLAQGAEEPHQRDWVMGEGVSAALPPEMQDQRQLYRALVDKYYQEYANEWTNLLNSLSIRLPTEPGQAAGKLSGFASATQGLPAVLARLQKETDLLVPASAGEKAVTKKLGAKVGKLAGMVQEARDAEKKRLKERFRFVEELNGVQAGGGLLQDYWASVKGLSEVLNKLALGGGEDGGAEAMEAAQQLFSGKAESPLNACWNAANNVRNRYESQTWLVPLLEGPVRDVAGYLAGVAGNQLEAAYKGKVASYYNQNLRGRYPLAKTGSQEVNLEDLKAFFNPTNGVFTAFVNGKLLPFVKASDGGYQPRHWNGIKIRFNPATLTGISQGMAVAGRLYAETQPRVYSLNVSLQESKNTAAVTFRLGEDKIIVRPGEGSGRFTFRWPSETSYKGSEILVNNVGGGSQGRRVDGAWGFLKLLDGARALNVRTGGLTAKWRFNVAGKYDVDVTLEGNIPDRENPFTFPDYFKFDLPPTLITDGDNRVSFAD
jgi:type VI secretion system protein ImpL